MIGKVATVKLPVRGTIYASGSNGSPTFLNLGRDYPSLSRFTVVIWGENREGSAPPSVGTPAGRSV